MPRKAHQAEDENVGADERAPPQAAHCKPTEADINPILRDGVLPSVTLHRADVGRQKDDLVLLGTNIDRWAEGNLPLSRQWLDKHEELVRRWSEFLVAFEWATKLPWEPDRKPSLKAV